MKKQKLSGSTKMLIALLAIVAVIAAYFLLIYNPTEERMEQLRSDIQTSNDNITNLKAQIQSLYDKQAIVEVGKLSGSSVQPYDKSLDEFKYLSGIIAALDPTYNISFNTPKSSQGSAFAKRDVSITFSVVGYETARRVIDALNNSPYRTYIGALSIKDMNFNIASMRGFSANNTMQIIMTMTFIEDCRLNKTGITIQKTASSSDSN